MMKKLLNRKSLPAMLVAGFGMAAVSFSSMTAARAQTPAAPPATGSTNTAAADPMVSGPAPRGKAWEPGWGFWPKVPAAWQQTHYGFVSQTSKGGVDILFLGDSLTKGWSGEGKEIWAKNYAPLKAANIGIGGDTTRQTLWRLDHKAMDGITPKVVVLMIGVNNIFTGTGTDEEIVQGVGEILKQIHARSRNSKVLVLGILPLGNTAQSERARNINSKVAPLCTGNVRFLDMSTKFVDAEGKVLPECYREDKVHLGAAGYTAWDAAMYPVLQEMLK